MNTWKIDASHTDVLFSTKHMMVTTVRGTFREVEGELEIDENDPLASRGEIRLATASISTGSAQRDGHLLTADFFDAANNPWIVAKAIGVERKGDDYLVHVDVTFHGITHPTTFQAEYLGIVPGMQGGRHVGFHLRGKISRKEWGLNWNVALETGGWLVGDEIKLEIDVAADLVEAAVPELVGAAY